MMTKVEELREIAIHVASMGFGEMSEYHGYNIGMYNEEKEAERLVDDLITAAKKEGRALVVWVDGEAEGCVSVLAPLRRKECLRNLLHRDVDANHSLTANFAG
jgi:hypothetical protein